MFANHRQIIKSNFGEMSAGITLIELMITLALGLLMISLLFQIYLSSEQTYRWQAALMTLTNNAKAAIALLQADIKAAGQIGCARLTPDFPIITHTDETLTPQNKLSVSNDKITVRHAGTVTALIEPMHDATILRVNKAVRFSKGDVLIIANCRQAEIFVAKTVAFTRDAQIILSASPLQYLYGEDAELSRFAINQYFVAKTSRKDIHGAPIYALYVKDIKQRKTELIENVDTMHFAYLRNQNGIIKEMPASSMIDVSRVIGVKIDLGLTSSAFKKIWHLYVAI